MINRRNKPLSPISKWLANAAKSRGGLRRAAGRSGAGSEARVRPRVGGQSPESRSRPQTPKKHVRYAVVGLGHIAQTAVLPGFEHARKNSQLVALFSDDPIKLKELTRKYRVPIAGRYKEYEAFLNSG